MVPNHSGGGSTKLGKHEHLIQAIKLQKSADMHFTAAHSKATISLIDEMITYENSCQF